MSGESTPRPHGVHEALERAFGERACCSGCAADVPDYRVLTLFLHDHAVLRAYCPACYDAALEGAYSTEGPWLALDFDAFAQRFGCPGPRPRPTALDRALLALMRDPALRRLSPATECHARRRGAPPHRVTATFRHEGGDATATALVTAVGGLAGSEGHPAARAALERAFAGGPS